MLIILLSCIAKLLTKGKLNLANIHLTIQRTNFSHDISVVLQKHLEETQRKSQQRIQERHKELDELRETVETYKRSAQTAVEDSERIFTDLIRSIERSRSEVTQLIRDQEKAAVSRAEEQLKRLEQGIEDLKKRDAELEQLLHTDHHIHFLQSFQSLSVPPGSTDSPKITVSSHLSFDDGGKSVSDLREKLEHFCREEIKKDNFQRFTLDPDIAFKHLCLSEGNRVLTFGHLQPYRDHPERFYVYAQALCRESVSGRSYWEVGWTGHRCLSIAVSYKSIGRKGDGNPIKLGSNNHSQKDRAYSCKWCIYLCKNIIMNMHLIKKQMYFVLKTQMTANHH
uniref:SPRY-associated domain-containing protein n=1 Tax=Sinocyclocheilus anshuiensis TaxID=1608454 RepID=A0A671K389_9TELE